MEYIRLKDNDISDAFLNEFDHVQVWTRQYINENGKLTLQEVSKKRTWDTEKRVRLSNHLRTLINDGGVVLGALFMATDYTTSPVTPKGQVIYGIGCGVLTVVFRYFGLFPEGVTYAILLMNACVWVIDTYTAPRRFGTKKGEAA